VIYETSKNIVELITYTLLVFSEAASCKFIVVTYETHLPEIERLIYIMHISLKFFDYKVK
jgi:hypothetical protein